MARPFSRSRGSRSQLLQIINPLIARPLSELTLFSALTITFPHTHIINVARECNFITYDAIWAKNLKPIISPNTPSGCATCYAVVAGALVCVVLCECLLYKCLFYFYTLHKINVYISIYYISTLLTYHNFIISSHNILVFIQYFFKILVHYFIIILFFNGFHYIIYIVEYI